MATEIPSGVHTPYILDIYGETYVLTGDIHAPGSVFSVRNDNITIDGAGHTIDFAESESGICIVIHGYVGLTVKNLNITQENKTFSDAIGISLEWACNSSYVQNININVAGYAVSVTNSENNHFSNCILSSSKNIALYTVNAYNNTFDACTIKSITPAPILIVDSENTYSNITVESDRASAPHSGGKHILCVGDSITQGMQECNGISFCKPLNEILNIDSQTWYVSNVGFAGATAAQGRIQFPQWLDIYNPDYVTILYGQNDLWAERTEQEIINDILWMANVAESRGITPIILLTPPVEGDNNLRLSYNINLKSQSVASGYSVIDTYDAIDSKKGNNLYDAFDYTYSLDGIHPNILGYKYISRAIAKRFVVNLGGELTANFTYSDTLGVQPFTVSFNNACTGEIVHWLWDFGDGTTSTEQNPTHTYESSGTFTVTLTIDNWIDEISVEKAGLVGVKWAGYSITRPFVSHVANGTFNNWTGGNPDNWTPKAGYMGVEIADDGIVSEHCLKITGDSNSAHRGWIWQGVDDWEHYVKAGVWVKITGLTQGALNISLWDGHILHTKKFTHNCDWRWVVWRIPSSNEYRYADIEIYTSDYLNTGATVYVNGLVFSDDGYYHAWEWEDTNLLSKGLVFTADREYQYATLVLEYDTFDIGCYLIGLTTATVDGSDCPIDFYLGSPGGQIRIDISNYDTNPHEFNIFSTYSDVGRYSTSDGLRWKGYTLWCRRGQGAPLLNRWANYGVYIDYLDRLHLTIKPIDDVWYSTEVDGELVFKYGTFKWVIDPAPFLMDDNLVLGLYTYGNDVNEHDIEITNWWGHYDSNTWFAIQPNSVYNGEFHPLEKVECTIDWYPDYCRYSIKTLNGEPLVVHTETDFIESTIPEGISMNLWQYGHPTNLAREDIIIYDFECVGYQPFDFPLSAIVENKLYSSILSTPVYSALFYQGCFSHPLTATFDNNKSNSAILNSKIYTAEFDQ